MAGAGAVGVADDQAVALEARKRALESLALHRQLRARQQRGDDAPARPAIRVLERTAACAHAARPAAARGSRARPGTPRNRARAGGRPSRRAPSSPG